MRSTILALAATAILVLAAPAPGAAQGPPDRAQENRERARERGPDQERGQGQARGQRGQGQEARGQGQEARGQEARGRERAARAQERRGPPARARARRGGPAPDVDRYNENVVERAVEARGRRSGQSARVRVQREDGRIRVAREDGEVLLDLDASTASELGYWRAAVVPPARDRTADRRPGERDPLDGVFGTGDRYPAQGADRSDAEARGGAPSFCRSGEGHPVWGRDWCLDHRFGLGDGSAAWGIDSGIEDIVLRRPDPERDVVDRGGLIEVLGDVVFGRLALQSLVLGADQPLEGRWLGREEGPRVLRIQAGDVPIAEVVDYGSDGRADRILFNLGR